MNKTIIGIMMALISLGVVKGGTFTVTTTPALQTDPATNDQYVDVGKNEAASPGLTFSIDATPLNGTVNGWNWSFSGGFPTSSTDQDAGTVTFSGPACYGNSNYCSVTFTHTGSSSENCSNPTSTISVNVIKPTLEFNSSGWSSDDTLPLSKTVGGYLVFDTLPPCGLGVQYTNSGVPEFGIPYEYIVKGLPSGSGAAASDFDIQETGAGVLTYWNSSNVEKHSQPFNGPNTPSYRAAVPNLVYSPGTGSMNPVVYAFDSPGFATLTVQAAMKTLQCNAMYYWCQLVGTPLYRENNNSPDSNQSVTQTFIGIVSSIADDGSGDYYYTGNAE